MKTVEIKAAAFFELLKMKDTSMWEIFSQMIDGEAKQLIFLDEDEKILFAYTLPTDQEQLEQDRKTFSAEYSGKLQSLN